VFGRQTARGTAGRRYTQGMYKADNNAGVTADLRARIAASGKTNRDIEAAAGLALGTVSRFVRGERNMTLGAAERTAAAIGYSLRLVRPQKAQAKKGR